MPTGGLAVAASVAYAMGRPLAYVRKEAKAHGTCKRVEGGLVAGGAVFVIEDVVTTGGSAAAALGPLLEVGGPGVVDAVFTIIDRQGGGEERLRREGVELHSLITLTEIVRCLRVEGRITREVAEHACGGR